MRIRRFEAPDSKTALAMVKAELGDEAIILANRTISAGGGASRRYGRTMVEVVAAMDYDLYSIAGYSDTSAEQPAAAVQVAVEEKRFAAAKSDLPAKTGTTEGSEASSGRMPMRSPLHPKSDKQGSGSETGSQPAWPARLQQKPEKAEDGHGIKGRRGRSSQPGPARQHAKPRPQADEVARWREQLIGQIRYNSLLDLKNGDQRIIALVGATGVGKTTTVAKIAAHARLHKGLKVALLSMDCYRIGATDQLRTYGRIMRLPCEIALKEKDLPRLIARHNDCDLIIIDTAGKSPYDDGHVEELTQWFAGVPQVEPYLTVSATTKKEDLKAVLDKYRQMKIEGLILTKLDETRAYATLCQQLAASKIPVSCLGTGQRVPEDLMPAGDETVGLLFREGWQALLDRCTAKCPVTSMQDQGVAV